MATPILFEHEIYERITDDIYWIGLNTILRLNVTLAKRSDDGSRIGYHSEYTYNTDKYTNINRVATMRRRFDYYLSIENNKSDSNGYKEFIMIRVQDIYYFRDKLNNITKWFYDKEFENIYAYKGTELFVLGRVFEVIELMGGKWIRIEPTIIYNDSKQGKEGLRIYLSNENNFVDIEIDRFMGLVYTINSIDMFTCAQNLINYLGRPAYGTNNYQFAETVERSSDIEVKNRQMNTQTNKTRSFFDL